MKVQSSDSSAQAVVANQTADSIASAKSIDTFKETKSAKSSEAEVKSTQQMGQQNKAAKNLEGSVRQHDLHSSLPSGGIILAQGKPPSQLTEEPAGETPGTSGTRSASKMRSSTANPGKLVMAENGIAIFKKGGNHTVYGENKDRIPGNPKDGVNGVYVEDNNGKPQVIIFDKNGKDGTIGRFYPEKFTPQQIVRMWEEERRANPKGSNEEIRQAVLKRRD